MRVRAKFTGLRMLSIVTCLVVASSVLSGCGSAGKRSGESEVLAVKTFTLANGMKVVIHEDHRVPLVKVSTKVGVGSADEPAGRGGFAHLFEHLMFMGTKAAPNFDVVMEQVGGENNAFTDFDETVFYESGPSNALPTLLWLEADRFSNLASYMTDAKVDLQRDVVLNEMRQNVLDTPGASAEEAANTGLFAKKHPYYRPVIGSIADLEAAKVDDVVDFFGRYYVPSNLTMIVAGDVDTDATIQKVETLFGPLPKRPLPAKPATPKKICSPCLSTQTFVDAVANPKVNIEWATPSTRVNGSIANPDLELAAIMLNDSFSNALQKHLVREQRLATSIGVSYDPKELAGYFEVSAEAAPDVKASVLTTAIETELAALVKSGFEPVELESARVKASISTAEALEEIGGRTDLIQTVVTRYGRADQFGEFQRRFDSVTGRSVETALGEIIAFSPRVTQIISPGERGDYPKVLTDSSGDPSGEKLRARAARVITRPFDLARGKVQVPAPDERTLKNGITIDYFRRPDAPRTRLLISLNGGAERDPKGSEGQAEFLAALMTRGAGERNAEAFTKALTLAGADASVTGDIGSYTVRFDAPTDGLEKSLSLLSDVIERPRFDPKEAELVTGEAVAGLESATQDPAEMAIRAMSAFYAPGDPNGRYATIESLKRLTQKGMRTEHRAVFQPQNASIVAAGSAPVEVLVEQLNTAFTGWTNSGAPTDKYVDQRPPNGELTTLLVDLPGASQTRLLYRATGIGPQDKGYRAADAAALILGGTFTSRLNAKLREEKGYTYGASARLEPYASFGLVRGGTSVEGSVTGPALQEFLNVVQKFSTGDLTEAETRIATSSSFAQSLSLISTSSGLVEAFQARKDLGLDWASLSEDFSQAARLQRADLNAGATILLDAKRTYIVVAGDLAKIRTQLDSLKLGKVSEVKPPV